MRTRLRQLLAHTHVDQDGRAVIYADHLAALLNTADTTTDRLVQHLATATGRSEAEIRQAEGIQP